MAETVAGIGTAGTVAEIASATGETTVAGIVDRRGSEIFGGWRRRFSWGRKDRSSRLMWDKSSAKRWCCHDGEEKGLSRAAQELTNQYQLILHRPSSFLGDSYATSNSKYWNLEDKHAV